MGVLEQVNSGEDANVHESSGEEESSIDEGHSNVMSKLRGEKGEKVANVEIKEVD